MKCYSISIVIIIVFFVFTQYADELSQLTLRTVFPVISDAHMDDVDDDDEITRKFHGAYKTKL